ncbi:ATP-binding protein [Deinococcus yavapaiensis]|uniref:Putative ATPase n=1 Tax=Deinococcus yavapaiensis KR-236 TaxID=694435 RepID=A0A318S985_9DEIO|nr:LuxR C-terminal-related transcriptional regulator [Deinococcus yavapaiensis]PYE52767.1 putative ATPase [Deinococcus yavapaiensis KR-236]
MSMSPRVRLSEPLIGRADEQAELRALLANRSVRLVTLTGPGGVGKTCLANAVLGDVRDLFADGAYHVPLEDVREAADVQVAVASALGLEGPGSWAAIGDALEARQVLLVLDNFEHLTSAADLLPSLLARAPSVKLLVTSRAPLRLSAERQYLVRPLLVPAPTLAPSAVLAFDAVRLFVERARSVRADLDLGEANASVLGEIARQLDGLPLALELAAARLRLFSPAELLERLERPLALLTTGHRDAPARHRTLHSTIQWSVQLLSPVARRVFARLAVFAGSFTLEAAEEVGGAGEDALDALTSLVEGSLVQVVAQGASTRLRLLEPLRAFAGALLDEVNERGATAERHAAYYLRSCETLEPDLHGPGQARALAVLESEEGNVRAALAFAGSRGLGDVTARFCAALWFYWWLRARHQESRRYFDAALQELDELPSLVRARLLLAAGSNDYLQGQLRQAMTRCEACLHLLDHFAAVTPEEARTVERTRTVALLGVGLCALDLGEAARAQRDLGEARTRALAWRGSSDAVAAAQALGRLALARGEREAARAWFEATVREARALAVANSEASGLQGLGLCHLPDAPASAYDALTRALTLAESVGDARVVASAFEGLALVGLVEKRGEEALALFGSVEGWRDALSLRRTSVEHTAYAAFLDAARATSAGAFDAAWQAGARLSPEDAWTRLRAALRPDSSDGDRAPPSNAAENERLEGERDLLLDLTPREREVLELVARGLTNRQVAAALQLSVHTVAAHVRSVFSKLDVQTRTGAVRAAIARGWLGAPR